MLLKKNTSIIITLLSIILIMLAAYYFLFTKNSDMLFMAQLHNFYNDTPEFYRECMDKPQGLFVWAGCFLTQLFYHQWIGISVLTAIWVVSFIALKQGLRMSGYLAPVLLLPFIYLLGEDISLGYKLYSMPPDGYLFKGSLILLCCSIILWIVSALAGLFFKANVSIISKIPSKLHLVTGLLLLIIVGGAGYSYLDSKNFSDENFHAECATYRCIDEQRWDDALYIIGNTRCNVTRELVNMKNLALINNGTIGDMMYHYDDFGVLPNTGDTAIHILPMVETSGPLFYLHHGMTSFAKRWAMENSVRFGRNFAFMKVMLMASLADDDSAVAMKYIDIFSHTLYYKEWAQHYLPLAKNPKLLSRYPEFKNIRELYLHRSNQTDTDGGKLESYLINYFSKTRRIDSRYMQSVCMTYALITKDIQTFWPQFMVYANYHDVMPIHYQEAAYLYGHLEPQTMDISKMPFDKEKIIDRYDLFNQRVQSLLRSGMDEKAIGEATRSEFGSTFWWAYYFNRGSQTY